jgi:hypothetical protein
MIALSLTPTIPARSPWKTLTARHFGGGRVTSPPFSPYEYFSYLFPGATVFGAFWVSTVGFPSTEPGAAAALAIVGVAFVAGHVVAAIAAWFEPLLWGHRPGSRPDPEWGMFGRSGTYNETDRASITEDLGVRFGSKPFRVAYNLAYTELQQAGKDAQLKVMNQQIGFYRNMAFACVLAVLIIAVESIRGNTLVPTLPWVPFLGFAAWMFVYRYRRFWGLFGDQVIRGFRDLMPSKKL